MSDAFAALQRALAITEHMRKAADRDKWHRVSELDAQRQPWLRQAKGAADPRNRELLRTLLEHNQYLVERATSARAALERKLSEHKYSHRALKTYVTSAR